MVNYIGVVGVQLCRAGPMESGNTTHKTLGELLVDRGGNGRTTGME